MLFAETGCAVAFPNIMEILSSNADPNVFWVVTVQRIKLALKTNAETRAQVLVDKMPNAMSFNTYLAAVVCLVLREIRSFFADRRQVISILFKAAQLLNLLRKWLLSSRKNFLEPVVTQPCNPSPCGPNSQCREINQQAVCSCLAGYIGSPPTCRPECVVSAECPLNQACINQKCVDPCPGTCGYGAKCEVINHNPICSCPPRYTGDPFTRCYPIRKSLFYNK